MTEKKDFRNCYNINQKIVEGKFGIIYEVETKDSKEKRAVKLIDKNKIRNAFKKKYFKEVTDEDLEPFINCFNKEIKILKIAEGINQRNENAVKFYEYFENDDEFVIVMELCDGNLLNYIIDKKIIFDDNQKYEIINQINKTISILVENNYNYIELKLENILLKFINEKNKYIVKLKLTNDGELKERFRKISPSLSSYEKTCINAPEILKGKGFTDKSDLWSMGVILYVLYFNEYPYTGNNVSEILNEISYGQNNLLKTGNSFLDDLIRKLLVEDPEQRISWEQYFNHPFFSMENEEKEKNDDFRKVYEIENEIGESGFATIYSAKIKGTNELRAIKVFDKNKIRKKIISKKFKESTNEDINPYIESFKNEFNHMKMIEGKNKDNINTVFIYESYENENEFAIVMELCDENMLSLITQKEEPFNEHEIYNILSQINNSFKIMVKNKLVHRAINLDNILVKYLLEENTQYILKLKLTNDSCLLNNIPNNSIINKEKNLNYIAPEILKNKNYNEKCDLWSLGLIIYVLAFKVHPFMSENISEILNQIKNIKNLLLSKKTNSPELDDLIKNLLVEEPEKRFNWNQYFNHPFFRQKENVRQHYIIMGKIGESDFASVYKGIKKEKKEKGEKEEIRAIKIYDKNKIKNHIKKKKFKMPTEEDMKPYIDGFNNEINYMKIVDDKNKLDTNAVRFYEHFHTDDEFAIVMELCDENFLSFYAKKSFSFSPKKIKEILNLLNNSFKRMVQYKIIHRELNLENILVKFENEKKERYTVKLKLTDNSGVRKNLTNITQSQILNGKLGFIAPEILKKKNFDEKSDLWSLGIIIYMLSFKQHPFKGENELDILNQIKNFEKNFNKKTTNPYLDDLIKKLLVEDPKKRLSWQEYFNHPFFTNKQDFRIFYEIENQIGETPIAIVYKAKHKITNEYRAIKIFDKRKIIDKFKKKNYREPTNEELKPYIISFNNEVEHMQIVEGRNKQNVNTVLLYEFYEKENEFAIVMELCDDNLFNYFIKKENPFTPKEVYNILIQLNNSFKIMSDYKLVHRDINLNNILIKYRNKDKTKFISKLKLTNDSGKLKDISENNKLYKLNSDINFMAPEILKGNKYNEVCDLWSLGVLIYVLLFKNNPFSGDSSIEILENISSRKEFEETNDINLNDLIKGLLEEDPKKRLNWKQYFNHPYFKRNETTENDDAFNNYMRMKNKIKMDDDKSKSYFK